MKLTHKLELLFIINNLSGLNESATADRIGKAIKDLELKKSKSTKSQMGNLLRNVIEDLRKLKAKLKGSDNGLLSKDIKIVSNIMNSLGFKSPKDKFSTTN